MPRISSFSSGSEISEGSTQRRRSLTIHGDTDGDEEEDEDKNRSRCSGRHSIVYIIYLRVIEYWWVQVSMLIRERMPVYCSMKTCTREQFTNVQWQLLYSLSVVVSSSSHFSQW
jgi:hypothetical protein